VTGTAERHETVCEVGAGHPVMVTADSTAVTGGAGTGRDVARVPRGALGTRTVDQLAVLLIRSGVSYPLWMVILLFSVLQLLVTSVWPALVLV
jgi:hypothetical protein